MDGIGLWLLRTEMGDPFGMALGVGARLIDSNKLWCHVRSGGSMAICRTPSTPTAASCCSASAMARRMGGARGMPLYAQAYPCFWPKIF